MMGRLRSAARAFSVWLASSSSSLSITVGPATIQISQRVESEPSEIAKRAKAIRAGVGSAPPSGSGDPIRGEGEDRAFFEGLPRSYTPIAPLALDPAGPLRTTRAQILLDGIREDRRL